MWIRHRTNLCRNSISFALRVQCVKLPIPSKF
uniref:Uncharacterized protein n=1 Tax=Ascaris lumbricoides TaxID=6252 RepID=A0A0M3IRU8_ASCLU